MAINLNLSYFGCGKVGVEVICIVIVTWVLWGCSSPTL